jgi:hypothetical protein
MKTDFGNPENTFRAFIHDFIDKDKQDRLIQFLSKQKNWWKLKIEFHTSSCFDLKKLVDIKPNEQYSDSIYLRMKELGATENCISLLDYLDGEEYNFDLKEKLADRVGYLIETIIYCPASKVGYFEGGHAKDRYIIKAN